MPVIPACRRSLHLAWVAVLLATWLAAPSAAQNNLHVAVASEEAPALAARFRASGLDVLHGPLAADHVELIVTPDEYGRLVEQGHALTVLARGRPWRQIAAERGEGSGAGAGAADGSVPAGYPDLASIEAQLAAQAAAHPDICQLVDLTDLYDTGPTVEGNALYALKISDAVEADEDEPAFLMVSTHHCRELVTPVIALDAIDRLLAGYGSDPQITALVDGWEIWIAPMWNPDGYEFVFSTDNLWRKNRRDNLDGEFGVDLNRNYPQGWADICAGSGSTFSSTYKGPSAGSEVETQTMMAFAQDNNFAKVLDYHSAGKEVLWGYACNVHPLDSFLQSEAAALSVASGYLGAERLPSAEGEHYEWQLAQLGSFAFLTETALDFQPAFIDAEAEAALVWPGTLWMLERPISLSGHVTDACTKLPLVASVDVPSLFFGHGEANHSGGAHGRYHLFLPAGDTTVEFSAPGYVSQSVPITVTANSADVADVALVPLAPAGCWTDLGSALAGTNGEPQLLGTGTLVGGDPVSLGLTNGLPSGTTALIVGLSALNAPFKGGTLVPNPDVQLFGLPLDGNGALLLSGTWPLFVPAGVSIVFQHWIADAGAPEGFAGSNAVQATSP